MFPRGGLHFNFTLEITNNSASLDIISTETAGTLSLHFQGTSSSKTVELLTTEPTPVFQKISSAAMATRMESKLSKINAIFLTFGFMILFEVVL